jgi:hypothetical protein
MSADNPRGAPAVVEERGQSDEEQISRRSAFGRMAAYTAPVMLALLVSEPSVAGS